jgi:adenosylhomocysteine nucleosidase
MKPENSETRVIIIISSNIEWKAILNIFPQINLNSSPFGQWFYTDIDVAQQKETIIFFHGGWGKVSTSASTQYVIDQWSPKIIINLGTCGGIEGEIEIGKIILVERTIIYDIVEQMSDFDEHIAYYTTDIDLSWLNNQYPINVYRDHILSGDRDLLVKDIPYLKSKYKAKVVDWESGAIAWVAKKNKTRCLILRGVTDLVGKNGGEAYDGNIRIFEERAKHVLNQLVNSLPGWIALVV